MIGDIILSGLRDGGLPARVVPLLALAGAVAAVVLVRRRAAGRPVSPVGFFVAPALLGLVGMVGRAVEMSAGLPAVQSAGDGLRAMLAPAALSVTALADQLGLLAATTLLLGTSLVLALRLPGRRRIGARPLLIVLLAGAGGMASRVGPMVAVNRVLDVSQAPAWGLLLGAVPLVVAAATTTPDDESDTADLVTAALTAGLGIVAMAVLGVVHSTTTSHRALSSVDVDARSKIMQAIEITSAAEVSAAVIVGLFGLAMFAVAVVGRGRSRALPAMNLPLALVALVVAVRTLTITVVLPETPFLELWEEDKDRPRAPLPSRDTAG